jgi:phosphoserine phosphatase RsbU/P
LNFWNRIREKLSPFAQTRLARFTAYLGGVELVLVVLRSIMVVAGAASVAGPLGGWISFLGLVLAVLVIALALRWFRDRVMWSVRNRLIVTYLFIGGVPVTLVLILAVGTGYLAAEHLATFIAISEMQAQEQRLGAANAAAAEEIVRRHTTAERIMANDTIFPSRSIMILPPASTPKWLKDGFTGLVSDSGKLYLRAANSISTPEGPALAVSSVAFDQKFLGKIAANLGVLTCERIDRNVSPTGKITTEVEARQTLSAGSLPPAKSSFDQEFPFGGLIQVIDWNSGEKEKLESRFLAGSTRPSAIVSYLGRSIGVWTGLIGVFLLGVAVAFTVVILIALLIGVRLTRTLTYSVANLYRATEHINRGDFNHRIQVRHKDQLGALQTAFNSMTESLQKLILEQKEKERLQSELEIAHEVQSQLFPQAACGTRTLEVYGACRPARIVSGDYYDFLSYSPAQVGIAVGDISGKGISAALLMATIHSAIRAYQQEQAMEAGVASAYGTGGTGPALLSTSASRIARPSPAETLWLLNRHLYQSTTPEKYATLFLGVYDDESRRLTYSNAGHLPPIILAQDGSTRRLDVGGTVVGLFDYVEYEKQTVELYPGDLFIAFSDGMTEPENEYGEFGEERLVETIATYRDLPLERICEHAVAAVQDWIGSNEQPDDVTLVLARRAI